MRKLQVEKNDAKDGDKNCDWVFTLNNYTKKDKEKLSKIICEYIIYAEEIAPTTGTKHLQGFVQFKNEKLFSTLKKSFPKIWLAKRKGSAKEASNYCRYADYPEMVEENEIIYERGEIIAKDRQGARTDLLKDAQNILNGQTTAENILIENPYKYHQYGRTYEKLQKVAYKRAPRVKACESATMYIGPSGVGKSYTSWERDYALNPEKYYIYPNDNNGWCDDYEGQEYCVFDEFRGEIPFKLLIELPRKLGLVLKRRTIGPIPFTSKHIIITSVLPIEKIYKNLDKEDTFEQFYARYTVKKITEKYIEGVIVNPSINEKLENFDEP